MRTVLCILLLLLAPQTSAAQIEHGDPIVVVIGTDQVRARTKPVPSGDGYAMGTFLTWVPRGTEMAYTEKRPFDNIGEWYHVRLPDGRDAWISGRYLRPEIARDALVVQATRLNVREQPSSGAGVMGQVQKGDVLGLVHESNGWYLAVLPDGRRGYVRGDFVVHRPLAPPEAEAPAGTPPEAAGEAGAPSEEDPVDHRLQAQDLVDEGKTPEAIEVYRRAIEEEPRNGVLHFELAKLLEQEGETEEAILHYRRALRGRPNRPEAKFYLDRLQQPAAPEEAAAEAGGGGPEEPPWTNALSAYGAYILPGAALGSLAFLVTMVLLYRRRQIARRTGGLYRRRKPDDGFDAVLKYAVEKRPVLREIEEAEKKLAEMDEALRKRFEAFGPNGADDATRLPPGETADALLQKIEGLRQTVLNQEERARVYSDLVMLQNEKIDALDEEIEALKKLVRLDFREGRGAAASGRPGGAASAEAPPGRPEEKKTPS